MDVLSQGPCSGLTILIVEDEPLILLDVAATFEKEGATVLPTHNLKQAMVLADSDGLSGAVIDHALIDGESTELRAKLVQRGIPFILHSGLERPTEGMERGIHMTKPSPPETLVSALLTLFHCQQ